MLTNLAWKEAREIAPIVAWALLIQFCLAAVPAESLWIDILVSYRTHGAIPFLSDTLSSMFLWVAGVAAIVLGLWQTVWESSRGTFQFLLHRPASWRALFGCKLCVGMGICLAVAILPTLCYALWAATPGTHASPFSWSMTAWAWQAILAMPLLYLGAFLSGLRPARLFGSRFFPLAAALVTFALMLALPGTIALPLTLTLELIFVAVILFVGQTRDYS